MATGAKIIKKEKPLDGAQNSDNIQTSSEIDKILGGLTAFQSIQNAFSRVATVLHDLFTRSRKHDTRIEQLEKQVKTLMEERTRS